MMVLLQGRLARHQGPLADIGWTHDEPVAFKLFVHNRLAMQLNY